MNGSQTSLDSDHNFSYLTEIVVLKITTDNFKDKAGKVVWLQPLGIMTGLINTATPPGAMLVTWPNQQGEVKRKSAERMCHTSNDDYYVVVEHKENLALEFITVEDLGFVQGQT